MQFRILYCEALLKLNLQWILLFNRDALIVSTRLENCVLEVSYIRRLNGIMLTFIDRCPFSSVLL